ncbi:hypothetical protein TI03_00550 [Achromatium sp. WMS1]|nr:hypothetical protein TI03_00550 [Achromatium sp. WMS1]
MSFNHKNSRLRQQIAQATARVLMANSTLSPERARRKAAIQMGVTNQKQWPNRAEVFAALTLEQRLFSPQQPIVLYRLRTQALAAMRHFIEFNPHLIGSVLDGTANDKSCVRLYLFADLPDQILLKLLDDGIPWEQHEQFLSYADGSRQSHPLFRFVAGETNIELIVLSPKAYYKPPLDALCEHPERGANIKQVEQLL